MPPPTPIIIDSTPYQRVALAAVRHALTQSHGSSFAAEFVREHRLAIYKSARRRVCGRSEDFTLREALRLAAESGPV